ncbi:unnamed protein product [Plutella xylostella]|uniref:(diamondback moth) hypothetical protein n=1 Tax=Plutella xylostella TaxID=51655 RepID=A0A8S4DLQ0_PLUXY|nr:unnamed protein product [Plutella xylostella]
MRKGSDNGETFDYIIVGAGSAGSVLASRLTELKNLRVLTIEAGGNPNDKGFVSVLDSEYVFSYQSQYSATTGQAQKIPGVVPLLRGKMLGGSSSCNGMWYCRGNPEDYNFWVESGFNGWDWNTVFPYFLKSENFTGDLVMSDPVYSSYHNTTGPLKVTQPIEDNEDLELTLKGIKEVLKVRETTYFRNANSSVVELDLPACKDYAFLSDEYWKCYALAMSASGFHPARTCAMGKVVDTNFKVYGVNRLRVIDASVFYDMPSGNLNAVVIMMAERAADLIKNGL